MQNLELGFVAKLLDQFKLFLERWKERITFHLAFDERQEKVGTARQSLLVDLRTAADEDVIREFRRIQFFKRIENQHFRLQLFTELGKTELVGALEIFSSTPFVVLPENLRMTFDEPLRMPRQDHVLAVRQRLAEALKRLAPHHDDVAHRHFLEPLEILRQVPRDFAARANHAVQRHCSDGFEMFDD